MAKLLRALMIIGSGVLHTGTWMYFTGFQLKIMHYDSTLLSDALIDNQIEVSQKEPIYSIIEGGASPQPKRKSWVAPFPEK